MELDAARRMLRTSGLVTVVAARERGIGTRELRDAVRRQELTRVRRGHYIGAERWDALSPRERHRVRVLAADTDMAGAVFSHESAAAVWGLPIVGRWPTAVHVSAPRTGGGRSRPGVVLHGSTADVPEEWHSGLRVTPVARTVADLARSGPFVSAVAAADHALARGLTTTPALQQAADALRGRPGAEVVRRLAATATPLAESVGESLSRVRMLELGLPRPVLQHLIHDHRGQIGRVDFWWEELGLVGEFDGRLKYRIDGVDDQRAVEERVWAEKVREDRIRATGARVVRWTWRTAMSPELLLAQLTAAGLHPTGRPVGRTG
ncbi:hypothetical protein [Cellulomonas hominis]